MVQGCSQAQRENRGSLLQTSQLTMTCQSKSRNNTFCVECQDLNRIQRSVSDVSHINPRQQPTWKHSSIPASFLFPWSLSLLGQKIWLRRLESAHENIMSKHGSNRRRIGGILCCTQSHHTLQSKAADPWRSPLLLSPCCSSILPLLPSASPLCPSN